MKLSVGNIGWFVCLVAIGVLSISAINYKKQSDLTAMDVDVFELGDGDHFLTESDVQQQVLGLFGGEMPTDVSDLSVEQIEKGMKDNPFVKDVDVFVNSDGELGVKVEQRRPVARVFSGGERYYLDTEGKVIPESQSFTARLPVLTGDVPVNQDSVGYADPALMSFLKTLREDAFYEALVEQLDFDSKELTIVPKTGSAVVKFGTIKNADQKLLNLKTFYRDVYSQQGFEGFSEINVSISGQIVCNKDNKKTN